MLFATEREIRLSTQDFKSGLQNVCEKLLSVSEAHAVVAKLGSEGLISLTADPRTDTSKLDALNRSPVDVAGAGDAMIATSSLFRASGVSNWEAIYAGAISSAIQISRNGNVPITKSELLGQLRQIKN
jgi:sugar/nucleoside kinase (ribokinase family)